jgi:flagellar basal-body rod protein FlgB
VVSVIRNIFSNTKVLEKALDATWLRNEVISHNIANVDTPGFKKSSVRFEDELEAAVLKRSVSGRRTRENHKSIGRLSVDRVKPEIFTPSGIAMREDGNNVDIDAEMAALANNTVMFNYLVQKITREFHRIRNVILEGRR